MSSSPPSTDLSARSRPSYATVRGPTTSAAGSSGLRPPISSATAVRGGATVSTTTRAKPVPKTVPHPSTARNSAHPSRAPLTGSFSHSSSYVVQKRPGGASLGTGSRASTVSESKAASVRKPISAATISATSAVDEWGFASSDVVDAPLVPPEPTHAHMSPPVAPPSAFRRVTASSAVAPARTSQSGHMSRSAARARTATDMGSALTKSNVNGQAPLAQSRAAARWVRPEASLASGRDSVAQPVPLAKKAEESSSTESGSDRVQKKQKGTSDSLRAHIAAMRLANADAAKSGNGESAKRTAATTGPGTGIRAVQTGSVRARVGGSAGTNVVAATSSSGGFGHTALKARLASARTSGVLSLAGIGMVDVPSKLIFYYSPPPPADLEDDGAGADSKMTVGSCNAGGWWDWNDLTSLDLSSNRIRSLPPALWRDPAAGSALSVLTLDDNPLPADGAWLLPLLGECKRLKVLRVRRVGLKVFPAAAAAAAAANAANACGGSSSSTLATDSVGTNSGVTGLTHLHLDGNELTTLPLELTALPLVVLTASRNALTSLFTADRDGTAHQEAAWSCIRTLAELTLSHNRLPSSAFGPLLSAAARECGGDSPPPALARLDLSRNVLTDPFPSLAPLARLQELTLAGNRLKTLPELPQARTGATTYSSRGVHSIIATDNMLSDCSSIAAVVASLLTLDLSSNKLTEVPPPLLPTNDGSVQSPCDSTASDFGGALRLKSLVLDGNSIDSLSNALAALPDLSLLSAAGNPFRSLPASTRTMAPAQLLKWIKRRAAPVDEMGAL